MLIGKADRHIPFLGLDLELLFSVVSPHFMVQIPWDLQPGLPQRKYVLLLVQCFIIALNWLYQYIHQKLENQHPLSKQTHNVVDSCITSGGANFHLQL